VNADDQLADLVAEADRRRSRPPAAEPTPTATGPTEPLTSYDVFTTNPAGGTAS
jgi:hypothetical protein